MNSNKNKKIPVPDKSRSVRKIDIIGIPIVWLFLLLLWTVCVINLIKGNYFGYTNYYNQPVGTLMLLMILIVATPVCFIMTIKTVRKRKVEVYSKPKWMDAPPWKLPWN